MREEEPENALDALDALRRRLYAPGATEDDAAGYRVALGSAGVPSSGRSEPVGSSGSTSGSGRRARARVVGLLLLPALAAAAAVALAHAGPPLSTRAVRPPLHAVTVQVPFATRAGFVRSLDAGHGAAFSDFIAEHPASRPPQLTTLTRAATEEHAATGSRSVVLEPSPLAEHGGRMTVILIVDRYGAVRWSAVRPAVRSDHRPYEQEVAAQRVVQAAGTPVSTTFRYTGAGPSRLRVVVAPGVRWDASVVFSD